MNLSRVYNKTTKGSRAVSSKSRALSSHYLRILSSINGKSTLESILAEVGKLTEKKFDEIITELFNEGYIKETTEDSLLTPSQFEIRKPIEVEEISAEDFLSASTPDEDENARKEREQREAEARAKAYAEEQARLATATHELKQSELSMLNTVDFLAQTTDPLDGELATEAAPQAQSATDSATSGLDVNNEAVARERARIEAEIKASEEAIRKTREEAAARQKLGAEIKLHDETAIRAKAEAEEKARVDAEIKAQIIARAEAERKAREENEATARREAQEKERLRAERKAREEAELKAHEEALTRAKREAEEKARLEAEIKAREEAMRKAREEAETRARREAEEKARIETERKAREKAKARAKAEAEEKERLEAERKARMAEEERAKREAEEKVRLETKRLAKEAAEARAKLEAEAKALADAERRAQKLAEAERKAEAKLRAKLEAEEKARAKAEEKARIRAERGPVDIHALLAPIFSASKRLAISLSVIVLLLLVLAQLINLSMLVNPIQKLASESIQEPVIVKGVHASLWPQPHLVLTDVTIGELMDIKASDISVYPELSSAFSEVKTLKSIQIESLTIDQDNLTRPMGWIASTNKLGKLKIGQVYLGKTLVKTHDFDLPMLNADIKFDDAGGLINTTISNENNHMTAVITPHNNDYEINLTAQDWQAPLGPAVVFDELTVRGTATRGQANLTQAEAKLYGGTVNAQFNINWTDSWNAAGSFQLAKVNLEKIIPVFSEQASLKGRLNAIGTFSMKANDPAKLIVTPEINANFEASDGYIDRIDLVHTLQIGGNKQGGGVSTHFDSFSGSLALKDGHYQFKQLALEAGQLKAIGEVDIQNNQNISGKIHTELNMKSRQLQSNSTLSGTVGSPTLN